MKSWSWTPGPRIGRPNWPPNLGLRSTARLGKTTSPQHAITACRLVTGNWVLWLDAGERIRAQHAAELRRFLDEQANPAIAYSVWVEVPPREEAASAEQCSQVRLLPTQAGFAIFRPGSRDAERRRSKRPDCKPPRRLAAFSVTRVSTSPSGSWPRPSATWPWPARKRKLPEIGRHGCCWRPARPTAFWAIKIRPAKCCGVRPRCRRPVRPIGWRPFTVS